MRSLEIVNAVQGDYIIAQYGKRRVLAQVINLVKGGCNAELDADRWKSPDIVQFHACDIIANLGPNPAHGSAYGLKIEPYFKTVSVEGFGDVRIFGRITKETWLAVKKGLQLAYSVLEKEGVTHFLKEGNVSIEYCPSRGKNLGYYHMKQHGKEASDVLMFRAQECQNPLLYKEVILHECAHGIYFRLLSPQQRAAWTKMHTRFASFVEHTSADIHKILERFQKSGELVKAFLSGLDDNDKLLFNACISELRQNYRLSNHELDELIDTNQAFEICKLWPKDALEFTEFEEALGEYAASKPTELYAMAYQLMHTKTEIPAAVKKLLLQQLAIVRKM